MHLLSAAAGSCFEQCHSGEGLLWDGSDMGMSWEKGGLSRGGSLEQAGESPADLARLPWHPEGWEKLPAALPSTKWKHDLSPRAKLPFVWRSGHFCSEAAGGAATAAPLVVVLGSSRCQEARWQGCVGQPELFFSTVPLARDIWVS